MQSLTQTSFRYLPIALIALTWEVVARFNLVDTLALPTLRFRMRTCCRFSGKAE